jgi:hypothetical protein
MAERFLTREGIVDEPTSDEAHAGVEVGVATPLAL